MRWDSLTFTDYQILFIYSSITVITVLAIKAVGFSKSVKFSVIHLQSL